MKLYSKIQTGGLWLGLRFIISGFIGVLSMPLIARTLSLEEYGIYNILFAASAWIAILTGFGLPNIFQRFIPKALHNKDYSLIISLVKKGLWLRFVLSLFAILVVILSSEPISNIFQIYSWNNYFLIFAFTIICILEVELWGFVFNGLFLHKYSVISNICWSIVRILLLSYVALNDKGLIGILLAEMASWGLWLSLLSIFYYKHFFVLHREVSDSELPYKRLLRYGGFSFFSEVGYSVLDMTTDLFVITIFLGPSAAGIYGFCDRVMKVFRRILPHTVLRNIIRPVFFSRYEETKDMKELSSMFNFLLKLSALFVFPFSVGLSVIGESFIFYVFGEKYLSAYLPLCIIVSFFAVNVFAEPTDLILQSIEKVNILFYSKIFAVYNLVGDLIVIKPFGVVGIAVVTSSAVLFKNLFCLYFAKRYASIKVNFWGLIKVVTNAALMGFVLYLGRSYISSLSSFIIVSFGGALLYVFLCYLNKVFTKEERNHMKKVLPQKMCIF